MPLVVRVAVKPTPSISQKQKTVDLKIWSNVELTLKAGMMFVLYPER